jgi:nucleotide-binding universal stress UspA family protein
MKKILVPTDFSQNAKHALHTAARVAKQSNAALVIMHANVEAVYVPPLAEYTGAMNFDMMDYGAAAAEELFALKNELSKTPGLEGVAIETTVEEGYLYNTLERVSQTEHCDLIVMGTKGATGAAEFFVGSNTEKVIRTAGCPVLAVPQDSGDFNIKTVLVPSTLKADQKKVFETLAAWQKKYGFEVKVLYLNNPAGFSDENAIEAASEAFAEAAGLEKVSTFVSSNTFNEEAAILQFAATNQVDLIAMGTHQRRGLSHLLFGSLTEDTANHSPVPVLSIPLS